MVSGGGVSSGSKPSASSARPFGGAAAEATRPFACNSARLADLFPADLAASRAELITTLTPAVRALGGSVTDAELVDLFASVYSAPAEHWGVYETCEELVDVEDAFQQWRFRHLQVVQRVIGHKIGTGGSSGVDFLRRALDLTFFPELYEVRTRIGS